MPFAGCALPPAFRLRYSETCHLEFSALFRLADERAGFRTAQIQAYKELIVACQGPYSFSVCECSTPAAEEAGVLSCGFTTT